MVQDITPDNYQFLSECLDRRSYATSCYDIIMASVDGTSRGEWSGGRDKPHPPGHFKSACYGMYIHVHVCGTHLQASCRGVSPNLSVQLISTSVF